MHVCLVYMMAHNMYAYFQYKSGKRCVIRNAHMYISYFIVIEFFSIVTYIDIYEELWDFPSAPILD